MEFTVAKIETMQSADLNVLSDNIYFSGCTRNCPFCFNKEIQDKASGELMEIEDILLSLSKVEWVSLIGGEPLEQNIKDLQVLVDFLQQNGKKVCIFTSFQEPWNIIKDADHYHIDIKTFAFEKGLPPPKHIKASYGIVSFSLTALKMNKAVECIIDQPIYLKTCVGIKYAENAKLDWSYLTLLGVKQLYLDQKIIVDDE